MKMKAKGQSAKAGDVIPYIFCVPPSGETTKTAQAANAHHPDDVRRQGSTLKIGELHPVRYSRFPRLTFSLPFQISRCISRLRSYRPWSVCASTSRAQRRRGWLNALVSGSRDREKCQSGPTDGPAFCATGLDAMRFKSSSLDVPEREFKTLQSQVSDAQRFADTEPFRIRCRTCGAESVSDGVGENQVRCRVRSARSSRAVLTGGRRFRLRPVFCPNTASSAATTNAWRRCRSRPSRCSSTSSSDDSSPSSTRPGWSATRRRAAIGLA